MCAFYFIERPLSMGSWIRGCDSVVWVAQAGLKNIVDDKVLKKLYHILSVVHDE